MNEKKPSSSAAVLERLIRRIIREEFDRMKRDMINELKSAPYIESNEMLVEQQVMEQKVPRFSSNELLNSLIGDTYLRSNGGNEHISVEGTNLPMQSSNRQQPTAKHSFNKKGLSLQEAIPTYDAQDYRGASFENGGLRVDNAAAIIQQSPGLQRALTRDYSELIKAFKRVGKNR